MKKKKVSSAQYNIEAEGKRKCCYCGKLGTGDIPIPGGIEFSICGDCARKIFPVPGKVELSSKGGDKHGRTEERN